MAELNLDEIEPILRCPRSGGRLRREEDCFVSLDTGTRYPLQSGVGFLATRHRLTPVLLDELFRYRRFYERLRDDLFEEERLLPRQGFMRDVIPLFQQFFDDVVPFIPFDENPLILDVGAGMCETSARLASLGGRVVATDFAAQDLMDPRYFTFLDAPDVRAEDFHLVNGLRRLREDEIVFPRFVAETERLPFEDGSFDVVFTRMSLHHVKNLRASLGEMGRVLKRGGVLAVAGEPLRPFHEPERWRREDELDYQEGIGEQTFRWYDYRRALSRAGVGDLRVLTRNMDGGLKTRRLSSYLGSRFSDCELSGWRCAIMHLLGGGFSFVARKNSEARSDFIPLTGRDRLAEELADFDAHAPDLRLEGLKTWTTLPGSYPAERMPQPACYGFERLSYEVGRPARRMYSDAVLLVPTGESGAKGLRLELNVTGEDVTLITRGYPGDVEKTHSLKPGAHVLELEPPEGEGTARGEMRLSSDGDGVVWFAGVWEVRD